MATLTFDPRSEDPENQPLEVFSVADASVAVEAMNFPTPQLETVTAGSIDTEGASIAARGHQNWQGSVTLGVREPSGAAATNLVTNPSFETGTGRWVVTAGLFNAAATSITQTSDNSCEGDYSGRIVTPATANSGARFAFGGGVTFLAGVTYYAKVRLALEAGASPGMQVALGVTGDVAYGGGGVATTITANWAEVLVTWTPSAPRTSVELAVYHPAASTATLLLDGVSVSTANVYFDGDTPGCAWAGTPHASTSTRPASGGPRFRATVADIEAKAAKLAREGGTLRWVNDGGESFTCTIEASDGYEFPYDIAYENRAATVTVTFTARPYWRGSEYAFLLHSSGGSDPALIFTETDIPGDVPALGRMVIMESFGNDQRLVVWGRESGFNPSADLLIEAETASTLSGGVATAADAGASGGSKLRVSGGGTTPVGSLGTFAGLQHKGAYRLLVRIKASSLAFTFGMEWLPEIASVVTGPLRSPYSTGAWQMCDLGVINVSGDYPWAFRLRSNKITGQTLDFDYVLLVPAQAGGQAQQDPALWGSNDLTIQHDRIVSSRAGYGQFRPGYEGDYLVLPVGTDVRFLVKVSRGFIDDRNPAYSDSVIGDDISAQVHVTPRWLNIR